MIDRQILSFLERDAIEFVSGKEHAVMKHVLEVEIRFDLGIIQVVFGLPHFLGIVLPIGWAKREAAFLRVDQLLHAPGFVASF